MISFKNSGNFDKTLSFLDHAFKKDYTSIIAKYGEKGVQALSASTPIDTGKTAYSWDYEISKENNNKIILYFTNSEVTNDGTPIAILIQYGHATRNGGFVQGIDFINPALKPVFQEMADELWGDIVNA